MMHEKCASGEGVKISVTIQPLVRGRRNPISLPLIKVTKVLVSQESLLITLPRVKEKRNQMRNLAMVS